MTEAKYLQRLIIVLVTIFLGTATSTLLQIFSLQDEVPLYQSAGRLVIKSPFSQDESGKLWQSQTKNYYDTVIETLLSDDIKSRAMDKAFALTPGLTSCEVHIQISQLKNSQIFNIVTTGREPDFTSVFLDALLDEIIAFQLSANERPSETLDAIVIQERASPAAKVLGDWQEPVFSGVLTGGLSGLIAGLLLAFTFVRPEKNINGSPLKSAGYSIIASNRLLIWGIAIGAVLGLLIQILRLTSQPQSFLSLAKVVAVQGLDLEKITSNQINDAYFGTIIETLESPQLNSKAMKRVRAQTPELKDHDMSVRVAQTKGSALFNVLATGNEPKYTKLFLNALLDEFMILRSRQAEEAGLEPRNDVAVQERATPATENIEDWSMPLIAGTLAGAWFGGLLGFISKMFFRRRQEPFPQFELNS